MSEISTSVKTVEVNGDTFYLREDILDHLKAMADKYKAQLDSAREVIDFYTEFWECDIGDPRCYNEKGNDLEEIRPGTFKGGKRARQWQKDNPK